MGIDSVATRRTPERRTPLMGGPLVERLTPATITVTTALTPLTLTAAQVLKKLLPVDCQDTGTVTLPTAALLGAAMPGIDIGDVVAFEIINFGDTTLTVAVGTGITSKVITTKSAVLTIVTLASKQFRLVCTGIANPSDPSQAYAFDLYAFGSTAAACA